MKGTEPQIDKLQEIVELSILYDFYGELLSEHKRRIFEDYVLNDLSLGEIAEEQHISRQGVYDIVKRCSQELKEYEKRLSLVQRFNNVKDALNRIKAISDEIKQSGDTMRMNEIDALTDDILKEL